MKTVTYFFTALEIVFQLESRQLSLWDVFLSLEEDIKETGMHLRNLRIKTPKGDKFGRGSSFISLPKRGHVSTEYFGVCFYVWYFFMNTPKARLRRRTFHEPNLIRNNVNLNYLDRLNWFRHRS